MQKVADRAGIGDDGGHRVVDVQRADAGRHGRAAGHNRVRQHPPRRTHCLQLTAGLELDAPFSHAADGPQAAGALGGGAVRGTA